jgi:hypothetical protein
MLTEDMFMSIFGGAPADGGEDRMPQVAAMATRHGFVVVPMVQFVEHTEWEPFTEPLDGEVSRAAVMSAFRRAARHHGEVRLAVLPGPSGFLAVEIRDEVHLEAFRQIVPDPGSYTVSCGLGGQFWYRLPDGLSAPSWAGQPVVVPPSVGYALHTPPLPAPDSLLKAAGLLVLG